VESKVLNKCLFLFSIFLIKISNVYCCELGRESLKIINNQKINDIKKLDTMVKLNLLKPKAWSLPYYDRDLGGERAKEILCLTARVAKNQLHVGHSALTRFSLDSSTSSKKLKSVKAKSIGLWPMKDTDMSDPSKGRVNLYTDKDADNFFNFEKSQETKSNATICVPLNKRESQDLDAFIKKHENTNWSIGYNCNDFAGEAFKLVTAIQLKSREAKTLFCSTPNAMTNSVRKLTEGLGKPKKFEYHPQGEKELNKLIQIEKNYKLTESLFRN
jgi:hypothetical protein